MLKKIACWFLGHDYVRRESWAEKLAIRAATEGIDVTTHAAPVFRCRYCGKVQE